MSADLLKLEELGLRLEELKKEINITKEENKELEDKKRNINFEIDSLDSEIEELYVKKNLKQNGTQLKNKNFFKLFKISMAIVFCVSIITDFIEGMTISQTFSPYFNFGVLFASFGMVVVPFHIAYTSKINKQCRTINLEEINNLIDSKIIRIRDLKKELVEIKNGLNLSFEKMKKKQEEMAFVRSAMKNLEQQIKVNTKMDRSPKKMVKTKQINQVVN